MNVIKILILSFLLMFGLLSCSDSNESSNKTNRYQNASMIRLISSPEKYSGKLVRTTAYLNIDGGRLSAYPSRDAYLARDNDSAFYLDLDPKKALELASKFKDRYCMIEGRLYYLNEPYYEFIKLGKFTEVKILVDTDFPRNDFQSKSIYVDDLAK